MRLSKAFIGISWRPVASYFFLMVLFLGILKLYAVEKISVVGAAAIAFLFAFILAWVLFKRVISPLNEIARAAEDMARGNLNRELKIYSQDEIGNLARNINDMAGKLKGNIAEISRERNRANAILNSMVDGVIAVDKSGSLILINPVVEELLQTTQQSVQGQKILEIIRSHELEEIFTIASNTRKSVTREVKLPILEPGIFKVQATPLEGTGQEEGGVVIILRDITERKKLEQMRTDFVANVSHELRTPLTSIHGFLETLLDGAMDDKETTKYFLALMSGETRRLTKLTNDLMDLSKMEELTSIQWQQVSVPTIIERVITIFRTPAEEKKLVLFDDIIGDLPLVKSDPDLLAQVLMNIVDNSIKFTPEGGTVTLQAVAGEKYVRINVVDTGLGIPTESLSRIFERFYRVDKSRARELGGMGLGLAIVKHVVKALHGQIEVNSREGRGSTFSLYFPVYDS